MSLNDPTLSTTPSQTSVKLGPPVTLQDTADLAGGFNPTGSITFTLVGPGGALVVNGEAVVEIGSATCRARDGVTPGLDPGGDELTGTYQWDDNYSGYRNNN